MKSEEAKKIGFRTTEKHLRERFTDSQLFVFLFPFHSLTIFLPAIWHSEKNVTRDDPPTTPSSALFVPVCVCLSVSLDCLDAKRLARDTTKANDKKETKKTERETRFRCVAKSDDVDDNALFGSSYSATQKRSVPRGHNVLLFIPEYTCAFRELARPLVQIFLFHSSLFFSFFSFFTFSPFNPSTSLVLSRPFHSYTENVFSNLCTPFSPPSGSFALIPRLTLTRWYSHRLNRRIVCARLNEARHRNSLEHFSNERRKVKEKHVKDETTFFSFFFSFFVYILALSDEEKRISWRDRATKTRKWFVKGVRQRGSRGPR